MIFINGIKSLFIVVTLSVCLKSLFDIKMYVYQSEKKAK